MQQRAEKDLKSKKRTEKRSAAQLEVNVRILVMSFSVRQALLFVLFVALYYADGEVALT